MKDIIMKINERIKFHEEQLGYMMSTTREMFMHEGANQRAKRTHRISRTKLRHIAIKEMEE